MKMNHKTLTLSVKIVMITLLVVTRSFAATYGLIDVSGSMGEKTADRHKRIDLVLESLGQARTSHLLDDVVLAPFSTELRGRFEAKQIATTKGWEEFQSSLQKEVAADRRTALWSVLKQFLIEVAPLPDGMLADVLIYTDGIDNESDRDATRQVFELLGSSKGRGIRLQFVGLGDVDLSAVKNSIPRGLATRISTTNSPNYRQLVPPTISLASEHVIAGEDLGTGVRNWPASAKLSWSLDGVPLGSGTDITLKNLTAGVHDIEVRSEDADGLVLTARRRFRVETPPATLTIDQPVRDEVTVGDPIFLAAHGREVDTPRWIVNGKPVGQGWALTVPANERGDIEIIAEAVARTDGAILRGVRQLRVTLPVVEVSFEAPAVATAGQPIRLVDTSRGPIASWAWTTSDGLRSTDRNPTVTLGDGTERTEGNVAVNLTVTTRDGRTLTSPAHSIRVQPVSRLPAPKVAVRFLAPLRAGEPAIGTAENSGGPVSDYRWFYSNGSSVGPTLSFTPDAPGHLLVRCVGAGPGGSDEAVAEVDVLPAFVQPSIKKIDVPARVTVGEIVRLGAIITGDFSETTWTMSDGKAVSGPDFKFTATVADEFVVTLTVFPRSAHHLPATSLVRLPVLAKPPTWRLWTFVTIGVVTVALVVGAAVWRRRHLLFGTVIVEGPKGAVSDRLRGLRHSLAATLRRAGLDPVDAHIRRGGAGLLLVLPSGQNISLGYGNGAPVMVGGGTLSVRR